MEQFTGIQVKLERQNRLRLQRIENIKKNTVIIVIVAIVYIAYTSIISILLSNSSSEIYMPSLGTIKTIEVEAYSDAAWQHKKDAFRVGRN